jgi:hypothetical protein
VGRRFKIDLFEALDLIWALEPIGYSELAGELSTRFRCSERAAEDAITILGSGRYVETKAAPRRDPGQPEGLFALRRRLYRVSERGHYLLNHPNGRFVLRAARRLFTSTPSRKTRRYQQMIEAEHGLERELRRVEKRLLVRPSRIQRPRFLS